MFKRRRKPAGSNGLTAFIDEGSEIEGRYTFSGTVMLNGRFTERVELKRTARVFGDVEAPVVVVEEGVLFEGHCRMTKANPNAETVPTRDFSVVPIKR